MTIELLVLVHWILYGESVNRSVWDGRTSLFPASKFSSVPIYIYILIYVENESLLK